MFHADVIHKYITKLYSDIGKVKLEVAEIIEESARPKIKRKTNEFAYELHLAATQCVFCGLEPLNEDGKLYQCEVCKVAQYCSNYCLEKYQAYHNLLCSEDPMNVLGQIENQQIEDIIASNRKLRKGKSVPIPLAVLSEESLKSKIQCQESLYRFKKCDQQ